MPILCLIVAAALWGGSFTASRAALLALPPLSIAFLRSVLTAIVMAPLALGRGRRDGRVGHGALPVLVLLGATAVFAYNILFLGGLRLAPSSDALLLMPTTAPLWTALVARRTLGERIDRRSAGALAVSCAGIALVVGGMAGGGGWDGRRALGDIILLSGAQVFGGSHSVAKVAALRTTPLVATAASNLFGPVLLLPLALGLEGWTAARGAPAAFWWQMAYLVVAGTVLAFTLWYRSVATLGAARSGAFLPLVPVFGLILSALFLGERPAPLQVAGGALVMASAMVAARRQPVPPTGDGKGEGESPLARR